MIFFVVFISLTFFEIEFFGKSIATRHARQEKQCVSLYVFLDNDLLINMMCNGAKRGGNRLLAAKNALHLAGALRNGRIGFLHQGRNISVRKAQQIQAAIVQVATGEVGISLGQSARELPEVAVGSLAQRHHLLLAQGIVLV